ncbi:MAG: glutamine-hydrolyzing GMP synthase, partial [Acidobacteria bacterium]|nr:glutamine-hydrolyzing GMP synthase [Acidobacteriota bacterium]
MAHQTILVLDFGSQYTQLIARRLRELSVYSEILPFSTTAEAIAERGAAGIILSGGPASLSEPGAPRCDPALFACGVPMLGICYGMQSMAAALGGVVSAAPEREYGHATVTTRGESRLLHGLPDTLQVWASHGDLVTAPPPGFAVLGTSPNAPVAVMADPGRSLHGVLFHPEVVHTTHGTALLRNFARDICGCAGDWTMASFVDDATARVREQVGPEGRVVCGVSGGVDSTVAALLVHRAIGDRLTCIFVDNGLLRLDEGEQVRSRFAERLSLPLVSEDASDAFLDGLAGVVDPERKRKIIGATFIDVFEAVAGRLGRFD